MGSDPSSVLRELESVIAARLQSAGRDKPSYVAKLAAGGVSAIGAKITEEAAEVVEAAGESGVAGREHLVREVADLVFHTMVLMAHRGASWLEVEAELARRFGTSGLDEKAARGQPRED
jgi:phosphoribosyl-ATP pyrophosphohydrolase